MTACIEHVGWLCCTHFSIGNTTYTRAVAHIRSRTCANAKLI